jgi:hypothetical protein
MTTRREITPEELTAVFNLAVIYPDLRVLEAEVKELAALRQRVVRGEAALKGLAESQTAVRQAILQVMRAKGLKVTSQPEVSPSILDTMLGKFKKSVAQ